MERTITAIYEGGLLRPLESLDLAEHESVRLKIISRARAAQPHWSRVEYSRAIRVLQRHGLIAQSTKPRSARRRVSEKRRRELARKLTGGKPLSQVIIDERAERA